MVYSKRLYSCQCTFNTFQGGPRLRASELKRYPDLEWSHHRPAVARATQNSSLLGSALWPVVPKFPASLSKATIGRPFGLTAISKARAIIYLLDNDDDDDTTPWLWVTRSRSRRASLQKKDVRPWWTFLRGYSLACRWCLLQGRFPRLGIRSPWEGVVAIWVNLRQGGCRLRV